MPCFKPLQGYRGRVAGASGKRPIVFKRELGFSDLPIKVPCGSCIGCRLERSRQWAIRCVHEAALYEDNCFITLTYSDEHIPEDRSLDVSHFQKFMKRLRKKYGNNIRFFHCGEYGEKYGRPHYHACIFNHDFKDKEPYKVTNGVTLYRSKDLEKLWPCGYSTIGDVTFESAAYVARYIMKKVTGELANERYEWIDEETGEVHRIRSEYTTMSRRPGIGKAWLDKYTSDVFPSDFIIINGKKVKPPKYYDRQYELTNPKEYRTVSSSRVRNAKKHAEDNTPERLKTREEVQKARLKQLVRNLD